MQFVLLMQLHSMLPIHILRIQCPDQKGLIAALTNLVAANGLNIVVMKEFVEPVSNSFFARLEIAGPLDIDALTKQIARVLPPRTNIQLHATRKKDIVIFVTREQHCLSDLLVRYFFDELNANVKAVVGNYDKLQSFTQKFDIPFIHVSHEDKTKAVFENELQEILIKYEPEFIVLAKFMRILSPEFVQRYQHRIINIHHSFLPAFVGANPYKQAYERGVKLIGATAHFVTNDLDEGPIITQKVINVDHEYSAAGMMKAGHEVEKAVLAEALKLVLEDRVFVTRNRTVVFD